jgi:hypothetical protein
MSTAKPATVSNPAKCSAHARSAPGGLIVLKRISCRVSSIEDGMLYPK